MIRDSDRQKVFQSRLFLLVIFQAVLFTVLLCRLYYLQVMQASKYQRLADKNRISTRLIPPVRGLIYDRYGRQIAVNMQNFRVSVIAEQTSGRLLQTLQTLGQLIVLSDADIQRVLIDAKRHKSFLPIMIKENLTWEEMALVQLNAPDLPGVFVEEDLSRQYPYMDILAHVMGYVSFVSENDLRGKSDAVLEIPGFKIGKSGLEAFYEKALRGIAGTRNLEVNVVGRVVREIDAQDGLRGEDLHLTIDLDLQKHIIELMGTHTGSAVVMDIETGDILAMVSAPSFDPNLFTQGILVDDWNALLTDEKAPLNNKVISGQYSPGSTFKMIVALAALESKAVTRDEKVTCHGSISFTRGSRPLHCWKRAGHGPIAMKEAIEESCDIYFYEIARRTGVDKITEMARRFGVGEPTGIDLLGERSGLLPTRRWKEFFYQSPWMQGDTINIGIGQGYLLMTPLQLTVMTARIANFGKAIKPHLLKKRGGESVVYPEPEQISVSKSDFKLMHDAMYGVVNHVKGTAYNSRTVVRGKRVAGKTGTTQVRTISMQEREAGLIKQEDLPWRLRDHALFTGFAPAENPKYAITVVIEHGGGAATIAAPVATSIMTEVLLKYPERDKTEVLP